MAFSCESTESETAYFDHAVPMQKITKYSFLVCVSMDLQVKMTIDLMCSDISLPGFTRKVLTDAKEQTGKK